jgi:uncharacterized protein (TIGR03437 family)
MASHLASRFLILILSLTLAGTGLFWRIKVAAYFPAESAITDVIISTVAGGGFGSNVPVKQAPMIQPTCVVFDPLGRGFYIVDDASGTSLVRFVNTSANPVTLAGVTILPKQINLIAGGGIQINDGINPRDADLAQITGLAVAPSGNLVYLATPAFSTIAAINLETQDIAVFGKTVKAGTINTIANPNFVDFRALTTRLTTGELYFIAGRIVYKLDNSGNIIAVAGGGNPGAGNGDGGIATQAQLITPMGLAFDSNNNLLIADGGDTRNVDGSVRRVNSTNIISSLALGLSFPTGIATAPNGDTYVALGNAQQIIRITPGGVKSIVAGKPEIQACDTSTNPACGDGGPATQAALNIPDSTANTTLVPAVDATGLYLPDFRYRRVRFVNLGSGSATILDTNIGPGNIATIVGSGLPSPYDGALATSAELFVPTGVDADTLGNLFISDTGNNRLRYVNRGSVTITLFPNTPFAITVQPGQIVSLNRNAGDLQSDDRITTAFFLAPQGLATTPQGVFIVDSQAGALIKIPPNSLIGRRSGVIRFLNTSNQDVTFFPNDVVAKVVVPPGQIKDIAGVRSPSNPQALGDGSPANIVAFYPTDLAVDLTGNIYIADQGNNRIRRINASNGIVSTVYGDGSTATLNGATGIALDDTGRLHIADTRNNRIIRQNAPGSSNFSVIADSTKGINRPRDLVVDGTGKIFITNAVANQIVELQAPNNTFGNTSVIAGTGVSGFSGDDGPGLQARLNLPNPGTAINDIQVTTNIMTLPGGNLVFADTINNRIRILKRQSSSTPVASVSAASFSGAELASESITAAFGEKLATGTQVATNTPLPTTLAGTAVKITDSSGIERPAPLFFAAPSQINYQIPQGTVTGPATILVISGDGTISTGTLNIAPVAPGLFTANASGQGVAAAVVLRINGNGAQSFEAVSQYDQTQKMFVPIPIDLGPQTDQLFLLLFGTGIRFRSSLSNVKATIGGIDAEVLFAGPAGGFVGLDQININIPRSLAGRGMVDVVLTVDGKIANTIKLAIK